MRPHRHGRMAALATAATEAIPFRRRAVCSSPPSILSTSRVGFCAGGSPIPSLPSRHPRPNITSLICSRSNRPEASLPVTARLTQPACRYASVFPRGSRPMMWRRSRSGSSASHLTARVVANRPLRTDTRPKDRAVARRLATCGV